MSLATRSREPEWMDGEDVSQAEFAACLRDLATVNTVTRARPPTLAFLASLPADRPLTILDVGFGEGDMLRSISRWATRRGRAVRLIGIDLNPRSAPAARAATPPGMAIEWRTGDAFACPDPIDVILSSLVTHHMADDGIVAFLRWMESTARVGWFVNDLHRHAIAYHGFRLLAGVARWHAFVRHDGPVSVARAFRRADWQRYLAEAGIGEARIDWRLPFRFCVTRIR